MRYLTTFIVSALMVGLLAPLVRDLALRFKIMDIPDEPRKIHKTPIPLLGGLAIFVGFIAVLWFTVLATSYLLDTSVHLKHLAGVSLGGLILIIGGYFDDRYNLKPWRQIIFPIVAALIIIASGIGIREITNPFGGTLSLVGWEKVLVWWQGIG